MRFESLDDRMIGGDREAIEPAEPASASNIRKRADLPGVQEFLQRRRNIEFHRFGQLVQRVGFWLWCLRRGDLDLYGLCLPRPYVQILFGDFLRVSVQDLDSQATPSAGISARLAWIDENE